MLPCSIDGVIATGNVLDGSASLNAAPAPNSKNIVDRKFCVTNQQWNSQRVKFDMLRYCTLMLEKGPVTRVVFVGFEIALVPGPSSILYQAQIQRCTPYGKCRRSVSLVYD